jgi:hypothetical protein
MKTIDLRKSVPAFEGAGEMSVYSRETLSMMRDALRDVYGDHWRDDWKEIESDFHDDDDETEEDNDALPAPLFNNAEEARAYVRGFSARLTFGDFDGEGES